LETEDILNYFIIFKFVRLLTEIALIGFVC